MHTNAREPESCRTSPPSGSLWAHNNLFAWGITVDSITRSPEERAQILEGLGFKKVAYNWESKDIATFDEQIEAFKRHGLEIIAWNMTDADDPSEVVDWKTRKIQDMNVLAGQSKAAPNAMSVAEMLDMFNRHHIAPQLWLQRRMRISKPVSEPNKPVSEWTDEEKNRGFRNRLSYDDPVATPREQALRVTQEATRIKALAELAAPYGVKVGLYKHGGWIGISGNQVAIIERLKTLGVTNVGIVYQFIHAHDEVDDTENFSAAWKRIEPYVLAVNITGVHEGRTTIYPILYPSQGELELRMMRTVQDSGWKGPVGLSPEKGGDAEVNLRKNIIGFDWLAAELRCPGSAGPVPFPR
jgi:sugar phosphate isomerase/epimerase